MIRPFSDADVDAAAELLAERHERHRSAEPLLPADVDFQAEVAREWRVDGASGVISEGGYLVARPDAYGSFTVGIGGQALRGDAERARDLYAAAAARWLAAGHRSHTVFVPSHDSALVDAWFRLEFGAAAALGIRETAHEEHDAGAAIRRGTPDDLRVAASLDRAMHESMHPSPSFSTHGYTEEEYLADWEGTWDSDDFVHFVAERDGVVVSHIVLFRRPPDLRVPKDSIDLASASTLPDARGRGIGRALTAHVLGWAHENGYPSMTSTGA